MLFSLKGFKKTPNISSFLRKAVFLMTLITTLLVSAGLMLHQYLQYNRFIEKQQKAFIAEEKLFIKDVVYNEYDYIDRQYGLFKNEVAERVKRNVIQAYGLAEQLYRQYHNRMPEAELKKLIIKAISGLKFSGEFEDVFINQLDGVGVYYPRNPDFFGKNLLRMSDANGENVVKNELALLSEKEEGFLYYDWNESELINGLKYSKITYVKRFSPFNWYLGAKQYLDDYLPQFEQEMARWVSAVRFRYGGYVFLNKIDGRPIVLDGEVYTDTLKFHQLADSVRRRVFLMQRDTALNNPNGGYFSYRWQKIDREELSPKISFVRYFPPCKWLIGAGFYVDELNQTLSAQRAQMRADMTDGIVHTLIILVLIILAEAFVVVRFNKRYHADFALFFDFFYKRTNMHVRLNVSEFYFEEFRKAGEAANQMVELQEKTNKKLVQEQVRATESDRLKTAFLANMSHEIRTPMNAILGFSELLDDSTQDEADKKLFVKLIRTNGEHLLALINDIIDLSKIEANLLAIRKKRVDLSKFLGDMACYYAGLVATKKNKQVNFRCESLLSVPFMIETDQLRLKQVLDNLVGNAVKFTHEGEIVLSVEHLDGFVRFSVTDTGIGIPDDQLDDIFERFQQARSHDQQYGGTGLGLAICENLVQLLGGEIGVKSEVGKGSKFWFTIPLN